MAYRILNLAAGVLAGCNNWQPTVAMSMYHRSQGEIDIPI